MDEANMEADGGQQERQAKNEKLWKAYPPETYRNTIAELVHFSSKTVNSNAALAGVRLASDDALDAPYVSARTLMARGVSLSLDYGKGGAAVAGICKQVNAVVRGNPFAEAASSEERRAIEDAMTGACSSAFSVGVEHVDHRLRQILIPKEGAEGGYVSMTPMTAGGICELLFEKDNGLVPRHNAACEEEGKRTGKPENGEEVGHGLDNGESATPGRTDLKAREEEEALLGNIAAAVLQRADEAREMLRDYAVMLPQEQNPETGTEALVSPVLRPIAMRGLLDPALRDSTWPRDMAWLVIGGMEHASYANGNRVMVLDVTATATVAGLLEEAFR